MNRFFLILIGAVILSGCATTKSDPNAQMMDRVMGELNRETAR